MTLNTHRFLRTISKAILILTGVGLVGYLGYMGYLSLSNTPYKVSISNVTDSSFTVSWVTDAPTEGVVYFKEKDSFLPGMFATLTSDKAYDDRDWEYNQNVCVTDFNESVPVDEDFTVTGDNFDCEDIDVKYKGTYYTHHVTLRNLDAQKEYFFRVGDGFWSWKTDEVSASTFSVLENIEAPKPVFGKVVFDEEFASYDSIIYGQFVNLREGKESVLYSSVTNEDGGWYLDASSVRTEEGEVFEMEDGNDFLYVTGQILNLYLTDVHEWLYGSFDGAYPDISWYTEEEELESMGINTMDDVLSYVNTKDIDKGDVLGRFVGEVEAAMVKDDVGDVVFPSSGSKPEQTTTSARKAEPNITHPADRDEVAMRREAAGEAIRQTRTESLSNQQNLDTNRPTSGGGGGFPNNSTEYNSIADASNSDNNDTCTYATILDCTIQDVELLERNASNWGYGNVAKRLGQLNGNIIDEDILKSIGLGGDSVALAGNLSVITGVAIRADDLGDLVWNMSEGKYITKESEEVEQEDTSFNTNNNSTPTKPVIAWGEHCDTDGGCRCVPPESMANYRCEASSGDKCEMNSCTITQINQNLDIEPVLISPIYMSALGLEPESFIETFSLFPYELGLRTILTIAIQTNDESMLQELQRYREQIASEESGININVEEIVRRYNYASSVMDSLSRNFNWNPLEGGVAIGGQFGQIVIGDGTTYLRDKVNNTITCSTSCPESLVQGEVMSLQEFTSTIIVEDWGSEFLKELNNVDEAFSYREYLLDESNWEREGLLGGNRVIETSSGTVFYRSGDRIKCVNDSDLDCDETWQDIEDFIDGVDEDTFFRLLNNNNGGNSFSPSLVKGAYAQETNTSTNSFFYLPESGFYTLEIGGIEIANKVETGDDIVHMFYIETNGIEGFQMPKDIENPTWEEDYVITSNALEIEYKKIGNLERKTFEEGINIISFENIMALGDEEEYTTAMDFVTWARKQGADIRSISRFKGGRWESGVRCDGTQESSCYGADFSIIPGEGYVVIANKDATLSLPVKQITSSVPLALSSGWNLIGIHGHNTAYTAKSFIGSINTISGLTADNVSWWPTSKGRYEGLQVSDGQTYGLDFPISPKNGYFVRIVDFVPSSSECKSIIWNPGGNLNGTCGHSRSIF